MKQKRKQFENRMRSICGIITAIIAIFVIGALLPNVFAVLGHVAVCAGGVLAGINLSSKSILELEELRGEKFKELEGILTKCETEKRDLNDDEIKNRNELRQALDKIDAEITAKTDIEEKRKKYAGKQTRREQKKEEEKAADSYSFVKAIREHIAGGLTGLEKEMDEEARTEARASGLGITGIGIPGIILSKEKRDVSATGMTTVAGDQGGTLIPTMKMGFIDVLRAKLVMSSLGAQFLTGLVGNISIPKKATASSAAWGSEIADAGETQPTFSDIEMSPRRLAAFCEISKQLILQASQDVESLVQGDLETAVRLAVEAASVNGNGDAGGAPKGILNIAGIGSVVGGDNGAKPSLQNIIDLETKVSAANADAGTLGYLTNTKVRGILKSTPKVAGYPDYIWQNSNTPLNGYNAAVTNQVPSTLVKGASTAVCSAILFGNFNDLIIGQWGGLDIVVDPYTKAKNNMIAITVNSFWDIAVRHPESFSAMIDALTA